MAYIDLKRKASPTSTISENYYPNIYIENRKLPFDKTDINKVVKVEAIIELKSLTVNSKGSTCNFDVKKIDFLKNKEAEDFVRRRVKTKKRKAGD